MAVNEERLFNYRLYHLVYHWAAFVAISVLLLSVGALVCVSPAIRYKGFLYFANILGGAASLFALRRGDETQGFLKHPRNLLLGALLTVVIVVINLLIISNSPHAQP